jgi:protein involved in polysaccharide export with SLBB domain
MKITSHAIRMFMLALVLFLQPVGATAQLLQTAPQAQVATQESDPDYRLGSGDKVRIIVFGEESLTGEFFVSGSGSLSLPLIGDIDVTEKTVRQLQAGIENKLKDGYIKDPRVSIEVLTYRPFYILGEVVKPGTYPYTSGLTVLNAVATAQGFTYRANTKKVFIKRASETKEREIALGSDVVVQPGDTIRIAERFF